MSETDSSKGNERVGRGGLTSIKESAPLLGRKKKTTVLSDEEEGMYDNDYPCRDFCNRHVFIGFMLFLSIAVLYICASGHTDERPPDLPVRVVEDVELPDRSETLSVVYHAQQDSYQLLPDPLDPTASARATYHTNVNHNGWNYFEAKALPTSSSHASYLNSLRSMGYLEGYTSWKEITDFYPNYYQSIFDTKSPVLCNPDMRILRFLQDNHQFMQSESLKHYQTSEHWLVVRGVLAQLEGMLAGFTAGQQAGRGGGEGARRRLDGKEKEEAGDVDLAALELTSMDVPSMMHFLILNGNGDMFTLIEKFSQIDKERNITFLGVDCDRAQRRMSAGGSGDADREGSRDFVYEYGSSVLDRKRAKLTGKGQDGYRTDHCSALVKVLPGGADVVFGHNTWDDYRNMGPRIFKHYIYPKWPLSQGKTGLTCPSAAKKCTAFCAERRSSSPPHTYFSSSPGWVTSVDDFYTTFTSPPVDAEADKDRGADDKECICNCDESKTAEYDELEIEKSVNLVDSPHSAENAVRENILDVKRSLTTDESKVDSHEKSSPRRSGGRLAVIETSLEIYSPELYALITPSSLLSWVRVRSANSLARNGADWSARFSFDHSGTYPNQWIILDFEKFSTPQKMNEGRLQPGFLTILEEMPGMIRSADQTEHLKAQTYWASYNIPFYEDLSVYSENTQLCQTQRNVYLFRNATLPGVDAAANSDDENDRLGHANCYASCARAKLFARLQTDVVDIPSALSVMSHNDFHKDVEAHGNPCEEIACREDLQPLDDDLNVFGAIDTKLSSVLEADTIFRGASASGDSSVSRLEESAPLIHLAPQPLLFPLPVVVPAIVDVSTSGGDNVSEQSMDLELATESDEDLFKQPRIFARQGPTHDGDNKPFCWSDFEARHDAWVERLISLREGGGGEQRRLRASEGHWRKRKPAFRYSHLGQPNCFNYEWEVFPPQSSSKE